MNEVEFKLKFLLNSLTLKVHEITDISDPKRVVEFNSHNCDSRKTQAFCSEMSEATKFPMLGVPLTPKSKLHKAYFCEISVGDSLFVSQEYANTLDIPKEFGSFIVEDNDTLGFLTDQNIDISKFNYVLKDQRRILPLYEVVFEYDEELERISRGSSICHKCKKSQAIMFCPSERANFCKECDAQIHYDDFLKRHSRIYFSDVKQKKFICCSHHPSKVIEHFCQTCMEPICTECKITGKHSSKEYADHSITSFIDACQMLKSRMYDSQQSLVGLLETCDKEIDRFKDKVGSFRNNVLSVKKQVEREFKNLMLQLDSIENSQRQAINAKYLDRICKSETIKRMESYPKELDPADLLSEFKSISEQRIKESHIVFDKLEIDKIEVQGKLSLKAPKEVGLRTPRSETKDKSVKWRIETLHITKEGDTLVN